MSKADATKELPLIPDLDPPKMGGSATDPADASKRGPGRPKGSKTTTKPKTDTAPKTPRGNSSNQVLREGIAGLYRTAGIGLGVMPGLVPVGTACISQADEIAAAWMDACEQSPKIRRFWEQMLTSSVYSKLLMAHAPIAVVALGPRIGQMFGGGGRAPEAARRGEGEPTPRTETPPPSSDNFAEAPIDLSDFNPAFGDSPFSESAAGV